MFKKLTSVISFFIFLSGAHAQLFQDTRVIYEPPYCWMNFCAGSPANFSFDRFGRAYYSVLEQVCPHCYSDGSLTRYDYNLNSHSGYHTYYDQHPLYPGTNYNAYYGIIYGDLSKIVGSSLAWSITVSVNNNYRFVSDDYLGNVYYLASDSLTKFDSTGNMLWKKSGGGNVVKPDVAGNYYVAGSSFAKYNSSGNLIRSLPYGGVTEFVMDDSCNVYLAYNGITKLDSAGNVVFQYPSSASKLAVDINHNIYYISSGNHVSKLDSIGNAILWTKTFPHGTLGGVGVDSLFNCYVMSSLDSGYIPPNIYCPAINQYSTYLAITKIAAQQYSDTIITNGVAWSKHRLCAGDSVNVSFSFFLQSAMPPFKVQLSDSNGSFTNATLLGSGTNNTLRVLIPYNIPSANGYRIRVKTTSGTPILIPNADGPFRINNKPPNIISVINAIPHYYNSYVTYYGCASMPIEIVCNSNVNYLYQWYYYDSYDHTYHVITGETDSIYTIPVSAYYSNSVIITDTSVGCTSDRSASVTFGYYQPTPATISNLPDSVCINHSPIILNGSGYYGSFSGDGMNGNKFYPDSAGVGTHAITNTNNNPGCGITDTTKYVTVNGLPSSSLVPTGPVSFCSGDSVILNTPYSSFRAYQWSKGGINITGATSSNYTAKLGGAYRVTVTSNVTGCSRTTGHAAILTKHLFPVPYITPQGSTTFCAGDSVILDANPGSGLIYKWKKDGILITGATSLNYTVTSAGEYKVQEINSYGCKRTSGGVTVTVPCRESEDIDGNSNQIIIYPNPSSGIIRVDSCGENISQITITSLSGQTILKKDIQNNFNSSLEIDLTDQSKGIYLIQVIADKEVYNQKIILD